MHCADCRARGCASTQFATKSGGPGVKSPQRAKALLVGCSIARLRGILAEGLAEEGPGPNTLIQSLK